MRDVEMMLVVMIAIATVGIIQWAKGIPLFSGVMGWVWSVVSLLLNFGLALANVGFVGWTWILTGAVALAVSQMCYEVIIQGVKNLVGRVLETPQPIAPPTP